MTGQKDRRLGARHVVGPVAVRWRLDVGPMGRAVEPADGSGAERAGLLDLSVSGARIMARTSPDLSVGDWTMVSIRGHSGPVAIRRIAPSRQEGFSHYGLEFLDPLSPLTQLVHEELARRHVGAELPANDPVAASTPADATAAPPAEHTVAAPPDGAAASPGPQDAAAAPAPTTGPVRPLGPPPPDAL